MKDIYKEASRQKLRFTTAKGVLSVEDIWALSIDALIPVGNELEKSLAKNQSTWHGVEEPTAAQKIDTLRFQIIKDIVETKHAEDKARRELADMKKQATTLAAVIEEKKHESLKALSADEQQRQLQALMAKIKELGG